MPMVKSAPVLTGKSFAPKPRAPHVIVRARAGTGKTTTLIEGLRLLKGLPTSITPSPQQRAVWDAILESKDRQRFVAFVAFNSSIAAELKDRVPPGVEAKTMHSLGFSAVRKAFTRVDVDDRRVEKIIVALTGWDDEDLPWHGVATRAATQLVGLCKMNLLGGSEVELLDLCHRHDVTFGDESAENEQEYERIRDEVFAVVPEALDRCKRVDLDGTIDYDDMVWLPVALNLNVFQFDLLLVDEAQDLNRCQQALAKRAGRRLIFVGDDAQAIYGFAGADSDSLNRLESELLKTPAGLHVLPLTVTRRCGRAIVAEAKRYVPDFEAHESNPDGEVKTAKYPTQTARGTTSQLADAETYLPLVRDGDMVVCRSNAPLVRQFFKLFKRGQRAYIQGRKDVAKQIASLITKFKSATTVPELITAVNEWREREVAKENAKPEPNEGKLATVADKAECVLVLAEECDTIPAMLQRINTMFEDGDRKGVRLSSIHKAKGLESDNVFFLVPGGFRDKHPRAQAWQWQQELNLRYVGITRAVKTLTYVF